MILAIDVGNTNIVIGGFCNDEILFKERISTNHSATDLEYAVNIKTALEMHHFSENDIEGAVISSVVPSVTNTICHAIKKYCDKNTMVVGPGIKTGLSINIDNPARLGSDLVVDAVAGISEYKAPMIIVDMGTATTFSVIDKNNNYCGGLITTGMAVSAEALSGRTSQLPKVSFDIPKKLIGTNTIDSMKSGIMYSAACSIDGICERIEEELGEKCTIIATGGLAHLIVPLCKKKVVCDDNLLLKGLMLIYNKNSQQ